MNKAIQQTPTITGDTVTGMKVLTQAELKSVSGGKHHHHHHKKSKHHPKRGKPSGGWGC